jgi:hypothetical protein
MADPTPSSSNENAATVATISVRRLRTLTIISLILNVVILTLLFLGGIAHHRALMRQRGEFRPMEYGGEYGGRGPWACRPFGGPRPWNGGPGPRFPGGMGGMGGMRGMMGDGGRPPDAAQMTDNIMDQLNQRLALTNDERAKIQPMVEEQVAEIQKQMEAQRAAMQKQIEDTKAKIKALLTPDQQKQFDMRPVPGQRPPPGD